MMRSFWSTRWVAVLVTLVFIFSSLITACAAPAAAPTATTAPAVKPTTAPAAPPAAAPTTAPAAAPTVAAPASAPTAAATPGATTGALQPALQGPPAAAGNFKIGIIGDATGPVNYVMGWIKDGVDFAIEDLTKAGWTGDKKITYVAEDAKSDPKLAVGSAQKLIQVDQVPVIFSGGSGVVLALEPVVAQAQVVLVNTMATSPKIPEQSKGWTFSNIPGTALEARAMAQYAFKELKKTKAAILYVNSEFGLGGRDVFKSTFEKLGGQIVASETHEAGATDFRTQLTKIRAANPEFIYMPSNPAEFGAALKNSKEMGINVQWSSINAAVTTESLNIAGDAAEGLIVDVFPFDPVNGTQAMKDYNARYLAKTGKPASIYQALTYDATMFVANAWKSGAKTPKDIRDFMAQYTGYSGPGGTYRFNPDLSVSMPVGIVKIQGGKQVKIVNEYKVE